MDDYTAPEGERKPRKPSRKLWLKRIEDETRAHKQWREQAKAAECAFQGKKGPKGEPAPVFPIWWATCQVTHAAIFANLPKPDVRKRYNDSPEGQNRLAQAIERCLTYTIDTTDFAGHAHRAVDDLLIAALGTAKVEMDAETGQATVVNPETGEPIIGEDGQPLTEERIVRQGLRIRHFSWSKFRWEPGKDWERCDWVSFDHDLTGEEIRKQFGVDLRKTGTNKGNESGKSAQERYAKTYVVYEIWDRATGLVLFLSDCHDDWLDLRPVPFKLQGFFPCPKPAMLGIKSDELEPTPDYVQVQEQCGQVNRLTQRIKAVTSQIKDRGFYDQSLAELAQLKDAPDGTLIPVKNLAERLNAAGKATFDSVLAMQDNDSKVKVLQALVAEREQQKQQIYEILGIADIIRGATQASETATAQQIKGAWANVRIGPKMQALAHFYRDVFRIMAEIIGEHFTPEAIRDMSGIELSPEEMEQLRSDVGRTFAIDVETDSTVAQDEHEERAQYGELVKAITQLLQAWAPLMQSGMVPADVLNVLLKGVVTRFKHGRELEDVLANLPGTVQQLQQQQQTIQQGAMQIQQLQQAVEQLQAELAKVNQRKEMREDAKTQADVTGKHAEAVKDLATARRTATEPMQIMPV